MEENTFKIQLHVYKKGTTPSFNKFLFPKDALQNFGEVDNTFSTFLLSFPLGKGYGPSFRQTYS